MQIVECEIPEVKMFTPQVFEDSRGSFFESYNQERWFKDQNISFIQDNQSTSKLNVLRGLHFQVKRPQGKLVRVVEGAILDVAVDIRCDSPTFGKHVAVLLTSANHRQLWIPPGFAHGFLTLSNSVTVLYKTTEYWIPEFDRSIHWNSEKLAIQWPISEPPIVSDKDESAPHFTHTNYE